MDALNFNFAPKFVQNKGPSALKFAFLVEHFLIETFSDNFRHPKIRGGTITPTASLPSCAMTLKRRSPETRRLKYKTHNHYFIYSSATLHS